MDNFHLPTTGNTKYMVTIQDARGGSVLIKKNDMALFVVIRKFKCERGGREAYLTD
jgi:hypothetical protein